ncbi:MAG: hypothetical protein DRN40_07500 [Thermoplasmata archaeon]|nr:MAG: hypothetical protein DRN40_07500 [Thermoplasmata archaeon]
MKTYRVLIGVIAVAVILTASLYLFFRSGDGEVKFSIKPKEVDLMADLEVGAIDYLFIYRSVAEQHGTAFVELPDEINLSNITYADSYSKVTVRRADGGEVKGKPIVYGVTIPDRYGPSEEERPYAVAFIKMLLSERGRRILSECGQKPSVTYHGTVPEGINASYPPAPKSGITLRVVHAGSLSIPFQRLKEEFERSFPGVRVNLEAYGSVMAIKHVTELHTNASVVASADYTLIPDLMDDYTSWYVTFAKNSIVLAYTDRSRFSDEINQNNWYRVILREGVVVGFSSPNVDPCGYRAIIVMQLADVHYSSGIMKVLEEETGIRSEVENNGYLITVPEDSRLMG